ncbi:MULTISPECIES: ribonuclease domain-containing protein [Streptomyces]|uniref:ribonuclease domain-containing protein n=1 Tax=Streptomyces TaxID=1883 RepID=UPI00073DF2B5|nr:ribonuclease N [Streptomyces sp. SID7810]CUW27157.1 Guanyl-specific ribonuclease Sa3 precursor [Streptomyces reticuli]
MLLRFVPRALSGPLVCLAVLCSVLLTGCASERGAATAPGVSTPAWATGMAAVPESRLPAEARRTLALIDQGGPFPYARDGVVFGNFEGRLPRQRRGYYHEYTVRTPGSPDRGPRRIVTGQGGEFYYTDDHYESFRAVLR